MIIAFLSLFSAAILYPLLWMIMISFKSNAEIRVNRTKFFPEEWTLSGYRTAFEKAPIGKWFFNSVFITVFVTVAVIFTSTLIGYIFAKYK